MTTCRVSELEGPLLDLAVAKAQGLNAQLRDGKCVRFLPFDPIVGHGDFTSFSPSTNWAQGGPLIDLNRITVAAPHDDAPAGREWQAWIGGVGMWAATPLIAAMRALVAAKLGDEVEL